MRFTMNFKGVFKNKITHVVTILSLIFVTFFISDSFSQQQEQDNSPWSHGAPMPTPRTEVTSSSLGDIVYVIGGFDANGDPTDIVEAYNVTSDTWNTNIEPIPLALHHAASAANQGKIYVVGGYSGDWDPSNRVFIYDPLSRQWTEATSMPTPRGSPNANFVNEILYVIGGDNGNPVNITESYDLDREQWTKQEPMPTPRHHAASAVVNGSIYVIGGRITGSLDNVDIVEKYNPILNKWSKDLEPMPSKRSGIAATSVNGSIYVFGGEQNQGTFDNNEKYDPQNNKWSVHQPMPTPRHGLGVASVDEKIFVIGGGPTPGLTVTNSNEVFDTGSRTIP